jgi:hypothetical protein
MPRLLYPLSVKKRRLQHILLAELISLKIRKFEKKGAPIFVSATRDHCRMARRA